MARNTVYAVLEGLNGGYLSDTVVYFSTKRDAQSYMIDLARELREDDYVVTGNARNGRYDYTPRDASEYHLGNSIILDQVNSSDIDSNVLDMLNSI